MVLILLVFLTGWGQSPHAASFLLFAAAAAAAAPWWRSYDRFSDELILRFRSPSSEFNDFNYTWSFLNWRLNEVVIARRVHERSYWKRRSPRTTLQLFVIQTTRVRFARPLGFVRACRSGPRGSRSDARAKRKKSVPLADTSVVTRRIIFYERVMYLRTRSM